MAIALPIPATSRPARSGLRPPRLRLDSIDRVRHELVKLYRQGRDGERDTQEVSRLANVLSIIGRMIEGGSLEQRVEALENRR